MFQDGILSSNEICNKTSTHNNLIILGPSGCGKSILVKKIGLENFKNNKIPIIIEAKYFDKNFVALLNSESLLLGNFHFHQLTEYCNYSGKQLSIIIDGFNECSSEQKTSLIRQVAETQIKYSFNIIITTQETPKEVSSLTFDILEVYEPSSDLKKTIAQKVSINKLSKGTLELLDVVKSCFEAEIVGQLNDNDNSKLSKFSLFEAYSRKLLTNEYERDGIRVLSELGCYFSKNLIFSLSSRSLNRILDQCKISQSTIQQLLGCNFLKKHDDRVSFGHELLLNAFIAESVIRDSNNNSDKILESLSAPRHSDQKSLIVGAIDDLSVLEEVLKKINDSDLVVDCLLGECGDYAQKWSKISFISVLKKIEFEVKNLQFQITKNSRMGISSVPESLQAWSDNEQAIIRALPIAISNSIFVNEFYEVTSFVEERMNQILIELKDEAHQNEVALKSALFAELFINQNSCIVFCRIISALPFSFFSKKKIKNNNIKDWIKSKLICSDIKNSQLLMLINLVRETESRAAFSLILPEMIHKRWKYMPYHLKISLLNLTHSCWDLPEHEKYELIQAINTIDTSNVMISTSVVEALKRLGGIESQGYEETIECELKQIFENSKDSLNWSLAQSMYNSQFDHPFDELYWNTLNELPDESRKLFLTMVVRAKNDFRMFVSSAISELAKFGDKESGKHIEHWTEAPPKPDPMPQDSIQVFTLAHIILGQLQYKPLLKAYNCTIEENTINAIGELYYWVNRTDLDTKERKLSCHKVWSILHNHKSGLAASTLYECHQSISNYDFRNKYEDIFKYFPEKLSEIYRQALINRELQKGNYFPWLKTDEVLVFGNYVLGHYGNKTDLPLLRRIADDSALGRSAIDAIKMLEKR